MKLFSIVTDNGTDFDRLHRLSPNLRTLKETRAPGADYIRVEDVTDRYKIDAAYLAQTLEAAGYGAVEVGIVTECVSSYEGATNHVPAPPRAPRAAKGEKTDTTPNE